MAARGVRGRLTMLGAAVLLTPLGLALGQERTSGNGELVLKDRRIEVLIDENLAIVKYTFNVFNPGDRLMEGQVSFDVPAGATGCELTLLRNIASTDRAGKVMEPRQAVAVYEAVRKKELTLDEVGSLETITFGPGNRPQAPRPAGGSEPSSGAGSTKAFDREEAKDLVDVPIETAPPPPPRNPGDPALLEQTGTDSYRIRFFPVPAFCDETVTATFAVELREKSKGYAMTLPLASESRFKKTSKTTEEMSVCLTTRGAVETFTSQTHAVPIKPAGAICQMSVPIDGKLRTFQLAYTLNRDAQTYNFRKAIEESEIVAPHARATAVTPERAYQAARVRSLVGALLGESKASADRIRTIAGKAKIVTNHTSLIVIDKWEQEETLRGAGFEKEMAKESLEAARSCDYVRQLAGLPKVGKGCGCCRQVTQTTDPSRIAEAKQKGWRTWTSPELPMFTCIDYVRHGEGCLLTDQNPASLKRLAGLMEK